MKKILVAVDSFKGSMTSLEAGNAIKKGIKSILPDTEVRVRPVADGGEGTTDALIYGRDGVSRERCYVTGPLGDRITAEYTIYNAADGRTAVMEMAVAAGLPLVPGNRRDPMHTTTYGVGEMINDAVSKGCERFIIGIGGSATNDGGIGMLQALGFYCLDADGHEVPYGAEGLGVLERIVIPGKMLVRKNSSELAVADPVDTPIVGTAAISGADRLLLCAGAAVRAPLVPVRGAVPGHLSGERRPPHRSGGDTAKAPPQLLRHPGLKRPDLHHDRRLLQPGPDVLPLCAPAIRLRRLHAGDRGVYVCLRLAHGPGGAVGGACGGGADGGLQKDSGRLRNEKHPE